MRTTRSFPPRTSFIQSSALACSVLFISCYEGPNSTVANGNSAGANADTDPPGGDPDPGATDGSTPGTNTTGPDADDGPGNNGNDGDTGGQQSDLWLPSPAVFRFVNGNAEALSFSHMIDNPDAVDLTFTEVGNWPVTIDSNAQTINYDGSLRPSDTPGLRIRAIAEGFTEESPLIEVSFVDAAAIPEVEYGLVHESNEGADSTIAWQSAFLGKNGQILSFGTGNHALNQSNAVRAIDPVTNPGELSTYDLFPWTQDISPPDMFDGMNRYVTNYDNHSSIYLPPDDRFVWFGHGVFDVVSQSWLYGNRPPFASDEGWRAYVDVDRENFAASYNPAVAYCDEIETGIFFGSSDGGYGVGRTELVRLLRNEGDTRPQWRAEISDLADQGVVPLHYARNTAVCIGTTLYVGGPGDEDDNNHFFSINVETQTLLETLTPYPIAAGEGDHFPQIVHDTRRDRLVFIGKGVFTYSFSEDDWTDVTPEGWPRYRFVNGVYHPALDKIFFRGTTEDYSCCRGPETRAPSWNWNSLVFTD